MTLAKGDRSLIIRTEKGLTIVGTRITLYDVIDLLKADYPKKLIKDKLNLSSRQIEAALSYIKSNNAAVEAEYNSVLQTRKEIYQYWQQKNQQRLTAIEVMPKDSTKKVLWS